jgi:hypothetical protein
LCTAKCSMGDSRSECRIVVVKPFFMASFHKKTRSASRGPGSGSL